MTARACSLSEGLGNECHGDSVEGDFGGEERLGVEEVTIAGCAQLETLGPCIQTVCGDALLIFNELGPVGREGGNGHGVHLLWFALLIQG